jgi:hypothetical protein
MERQRSVMNRTVWVVSVLAFFATSLLKVSADLVPVDIVPRRFPVSVMTPSGLFVSRTSPDPVYQEWPLVAIILQTQDAATLETTKALVTKIAGRL